MLLELQTWIYIAQLYVPFLFQIYSPFHILKHHLKKKFHRKKMYIFCIIPLPVNFSHYFINFPFPPMIYEFIIPLSFKTEHVLGYVVEISAIPRKYYILHAFCTCNYMKHIIPVFWMGN